MLSAFWLHLKKIKPVPDIVVILLCLSVPITAFSSSSQEDAQASIRVEQLDALQKKYDGNVAKRFAAWKKLLIEQKKKTIMEKLEATNRFFNMFYYQSDDTFVGSDYWKSPSEFMVDGGGDCEDFSIIKYFTLLALDVPEKSLRITYVKSLRLNQAHMVLAYYSSPEAEPLILDNLVSEILPASQRKDLIPVYSFNGEGIWLSKRRGQDRLMGDTKNFSKWREMIERMKRGKENDIN